MTHGAVGHTRPCRCLWFRGVTPRPSTHLSLDLGFLICSRDLRLRESGAPRLLAGFWQAAVSHFSPTEFGTGERQ